MFLRILGILQNSFNLGTKRDLVRLGQNRVLKIWSNLIGYFIQGIGNPVRDPLRDQSDALVSVLLDSVFAMEVLQ